MVNSFDAEECDEDACREMKRNEERLPKKHPLSTTFCINLGFHEEAGVRVFRTRLAATTVAPAPIADYRWFRPARTGTLVFRFAFGLNAAPLKHQ